MDDREILFRLIWSLTLASHMGEVVDAVDETLNLLGERDRGIAVTARWDTDEDISWEESAQRLRDELKALHGVDGGLWSVKSDH